jgi:hypothetical protein
MGVRAGAEHHATGVEPPAAGAHPDAGTGTLERLDRAPLVDPNALPLRLGAQPIHQLYRIEDAAAAHANAAEIKGRAQCLADFVPAEEPEGIEPEPPRGLDRAPCLFEVRRRERHHEPAGGLVIAVDPALPEEPHHFGHVALAQPRQPARFTLAEVPDRKAVAVVQRLGQHPRVPAGGAMAGELLLHHGDGHVRVQLLQGEGRPQSGEAGPDNHDVGRMVTLE